jgi:hypothetical protein
MRTINIFFFSALFYFGFAEVKSLVYAQIPIRVNQLTKLKYGYSVHVLGDEDDCIDCGKKDINTITVYKNGTIIFTDSTAWYSGGGKTYPLLLHFDSDRDELLISTRNDVLIRLTVKSSHVMKVDSLPYFEGAFLDPSNNRQLIFRGPDISLGYQLWFEDTTPYRPELYYKLTSNSLILDTSMTESVNRQIYSKFYGFNGSDALSFSSSKIGKAWNRVKKRQHYLSTKALHAIIDNEF